MYRERNSRKEAEVTGSAEDYVDRKRYTWISLPCAYE
jgi:hypothetical protein